VGLEGGKRDNLRIRERGQKKPYFRAILEERNDHLTNNLFGCII